MIFRSAQFGTLFYTNSNAEEIEAALAGIWEKGGNITFTFDNGTVTRDNNGKITEGTYEINTEKSEIAVSLQESVGHTNFRLHYTYEDGTLTFDNDELVKQ